MTKVIQGSCDGWKHLAGIRTKCKWQKGPCHWLWSGYHVAFSFLPATQLGVFLFPHSRFALVEVWVAACYPTLLWGLLVIFPSLQRYQQWFQLRDQCCLSNAATWQLVCVSPPNQCLNSCLLLPGLRNCRRDGIGHIPGRKSPEEWVSFSGVPCWRQSSTVKDFFWLNILLLG